MVSLNPYIPVRIALPFCAGIILSISVKGKITAELSVCLCFLCYSAYIISYKVAAQKFGSRWIPGALAQLGLLASGVSIVAIMQENDRDIDARLECYSREAFICRIDEKPVSRTASVSGKATILALVDSVSGCHPVRAGILLYFRNDSTVLSILPGDIIMIKSDLQKIPGPSNPGNFDYRKYLFYNRIRWQSFAGQGQWGQIKDHKVPGVKRWSQRSKSRLHETLKNFNIEGNNLGLASGLLLGDKQLLDSDVIRDFSYAGAMHVLSVSGLHVGIMYILADRLLFFLKRGRYGGKIQQSVIIILIWIYAFLTGLPASVVRAGLMFSLIAVARMTNRSHEGFNILAGAAFLQLWMSPYSIMNVGFQLSYFAVLGIFMFYKPINNTFSGSGSVFSWIWSVIAVSMAAQLGTFPLASYYFHFFSVYFLITNLLVVPIAGVVVYLALFLLVAGNLGIEYAWLGLPLKWSLQFMQRSVDLIQSWPGSVIDQIYLTEFQVIFIFLAILGLYLWISGFNRKGPVLLIAAIIPVFVISGIDRMGRAGQVRIVVYHIPGHTAVDMVSGSGSKCICDSSLLSNPGKISYNIQPNRNLLGVRQVSTYHPGNDFVNSPEEGTWIYYPFAYFNDKRMAFIDGNWQSDRYNTRIPVDLLIIHGKKVPSLAEALKVLDIGQCIIDGSVPRYRAEQLYNEALELGLPCHSTWKDGGFVLKW